MSNQLSTIKKYAYGAVFLAVFGWLVWVYPQQSEAAGGKDSKGDNMVKLKL